jgi:hypothetical protein
MRTHRIATPLSLLRLDDYRDARDHARELCRRLSIPAEVAERHEGGELGVRLESRLQSCRRCDDLSLAVVILGP